MAALPARFSIRLPCSNNRMRQSPHLPLLLALAAILLQACSAAPHPTWARFDQEAVAADHELASKAGEEVLKEGGNAVDAAVATSFALSVVRPYSCGIGGGGFMVIHFTDLGVKVARRNGREISGPRDVALDYRETAPAFASPEYYERLGDTDASTRGGRAIAIPGTVAGLLHALDTFGTLPRATVLAPAIRLAEQGFPADENYAANARTMIERFEKHPDWNSRFGVLWHRFLLDGAVKAGDLITLPEQGAALRLIARDGAAAFYSGPIADSIIDAARADHSDLTRDDLSHYQVATVAPLRFAYRDWTFLAMPPPSSGGVAMAEALHILERILPAPPHPLNVGTNVAQLREVVAYANREGKKVRQYRFGPVYNHCLAEAFKHAFADRARWLGDPAFVGVPADTLISDAYAQDRAAATSLAHTLPPEDYGSRDIPKAAPRPDHGTSHLSVVDQWGDAVACTETINLLFGSCIVVPEFGFCLNDEMDDFTTRRGQSNEFHLVQSEANAPAPGKRPLSSMTPTIVLDDSGRVKAVAGASGGPRIITATMQALLNALLLEDTVGDAVARPRIHHQWSPDTLELEPGLYDGPESRLGPWTPGGVSTLPEALNQLGQHTRRAEPDEVADVQFILRDEEDKWSAACDPRKGGRPAGR